MLLNTSNGCRKASAEFIKLQTPGKLLLVDRGLIRKLPCSNHKCSCALRRLQHRLCWERNFASPVSVGSLSNRLSLLSLLLLYTPHRSSAYQMKLLGCWLYSDLLTILKRWLTK